MSSNQAGWAVNTAALIWQMTRQLCTLACRCMCILRMCNLACRMSCIRSQTKAFLGPTSIATLLQLTKQIPAGEPLSSQHSNSHSIVVQQSTTAC